MEDYLKIIKSLTVLLKEAEPYCPMYTRMKIIETLNNLKRDDGENAK